LANPSPFLPGNPTNFWHATCGKSYMARKMNTLRLSQETRGEAAVSNRRPTQPAAALYFTQLRPPILKVPARSLRRIAVQVEEPPSAACVVKIIQAGSI
jgi:hypothetical protein